MVENLRIATILVACKKARSILSQWATETVDRSTKKAVTCQQICRVLRMHEGAEYANISLTGMHYVSLTLGQEFA
jgi:hypothetical protein